MTDRLRPRTRDTVDTFWWQSFGCTPEELRPPRTVVITRPVSDDGPLVYAMSFGAEPVVAVRATHATSLSPVLGQWTRETLQDPLGVGATLRVPNERVMGPAYVGYADDTWGGTIAHIAIVSHPAFRGRGHGRAAVSRIALHALEQGLVAQYRTLESNTPSRAIADTLGFVPYATSLAVRAGGMERDS